MANPRNKLALDGQQSTGSGAATRSNGHRSVTLMVALQNYADADSVEVVLEGSADGDRWDTVDDRQGNVVTVDDAVLDEDPDSGEYTGSVSVDGLYYEFLRPRVVTLDDDADGDLTVDAWVLAAGNSGSGTRGNPDGS